MTDVHVTISKDSSSDFPEAKAGFRYVAGDRHSPEHERFYALLTARNRGLLSDDDQVVLRNSIVLVAGCGGIGGAVIEPLVRAGAESIVLADNGRYSIYDLGSEAVSLPEVGRLKTDAIAARIRVINPYVQVTITSAGVTDDNADELVAGADLIVDGIGAIDTNALRAKLRLHLSAKEQRKPVVSGYDVAGSLWVAVYDYRDADVRLLDGKVWAEEIETIGPVEFLSRIFASLRMPIEMVPEFERHMLGQTISPPALASTALLYGALSVRLVVDILTGRPVRSSIQIDIPSQLRPRRERLKVAGRRLALMYAVNSRLRDVRRAGRLGVYSPLDDEVFAEMRDYLEERVWEAGSVIVRQGDHGRDFFVVAEGKVQVEREHDDPTLEPDIIATLGPGEYFGELALLTDQPRNASVVAATRCRVLSLSRDAFEAYLAESATARQRLAETSVQRARTD